MCAFPYQGNLNPYRHVIPFNGYYPQYPIAPYPHSSYNPGYSYDQGGWPIPYNYGYSIGRAPWDLPSLPSLPELPSLPSLPPISCGFTGYKSNKRDRQAAVAEGGWHVAWAYDISETDVGLGLVSAGVSVFSSNPAPFMAWITDLTNRTIASLNASAQQQFTPEVKREVEGLAFDIIKKAIQGRSAREITKDFERIQVKAGAIEYNGGNYLCSNLITPTWGMKPYIAVRIAGDVYI
ncbi:hypothetical protein [Paenibacillus illinoisensis]|uniref:hypothetical protein n=1 Tax=Paenibacillus illinoisensis TaxID=59845 RepID=UPI00301CD1E9